MVSYIGRLAAAAALVVPAVFAAPAANNLKISNPNAKDIVPDSYIVVYNPEVSSDSFKASIAEVNNVLRKRDVSGRLGKAYEIGDFRGYEITADTATLAELVASPDVSLAHVIYTVLSLTVY